MAERIVKANGIELCTEAFGEPADASILLVMGRGASMLWLEEGSCRMLAEWGRFVIRYDHRDTGRSPAYEPGHPAYCGADLVADAAGVLDAYEIPAAHVVGVSAGGALAQLLALDFPERVLSLVLISTSLAVPTGRGLPPPTAEFSRFVGTGEVDWSAPESVIAYLVDYWRVLAGGRRAFDEAAFRALARRDVERARDFRAAQNHHMLPDEERLRAPLSSISAPTQVIHGTADPMFPIGHGEAHATEIPGGRLLRLEGAGHGVDRADWETIVAAIVEHRSCASASTSRSSTSLPTRRLSRACAPRPRRPAGTARIGIWLVVLSAILLGYGYWWGALLLAAAALHFRRWSPRGRAGGGRPVVAAWRDARRPSC